MKHKRRKKPKACKNEFKTKQEWFHWELKCTEDFSYCISLLHCSYYYSNYYSSICSSSSSIQQYIRSYYYYYYYCDFFFLFFYHMYFKSSFNLLQYMFCPGANFNGLVINPEIQGFIMEINAGRSVSSILQASLQQSLYSDECSRNLYGTK